MALDAAHRPAIIIDNGSGFTKLGFAGNVEPSFVVPTVVAMRDTPAATSAASTATSAALQYRMACVVADEDCLVGEEAAAAARPGRHQIVHPIERGQVSNWDAMERLWQRSIFSFLRVDPEDHYFVLSESPLVPLEQRDLTAEIFFETFNVPGLYIGQQPLLALTAANAVCQTPLTGIVVDAGHSQTSITPIVDGLCLSSCIQTMPLGGREVSACLLQLIKDRGEPVPAEDAEEISRRVKEAHCYVCSDMIKEFAKHDREPLKYRKKWTANNSRTGSSFSFDVGHERFIAPEAFFAPEIFLPDFATPLPSLINTAIQSAPIDARRSLYKNIILSGGSSQLKDFERRIQRDLKRLTESKQISKTMLPSLGAVQAIDVSVVCHPMQAHASWFGGSVLGSSPSFATTCHSRQDYFEYGPSICRRTQAAKGFRF